MPGGGSASPVPPRPWNSMPGGGSASPVPPRPWNSMPGGGSASPAPPRPWNSMPGGGSASPAPPRPWNSLPDAKESEPFSTCKSKRILNTVSSIKQLENCSVIEGNLQILLIESDRNLTDEWSKYSFPDLVEITGFLLVFRVHGLQSLGQLFPNLAVIRGLTTHMDYALIIWYAEHMKTVGLHNLTSILRGNVWIENNAKLCTVDTDWSLITTENYTDNVFKRNKIDCDPCTSPLACRLEHCRLGNICRKKCDPKCGNRGCTSHSLCCHEDCVGGCEKPNDTLSCTACRHVKEENQCKKKCDGTYYYKYLGYRCVTRRKCVGNGGYPLALPGREQECVRKCPLGYEKGTKPGRGGKEVPYCKECNGSVCEKTCRSQFISSAGNAQALKGCTVIAGSLEISISGGANISKRLRESLANIREVTGYVRVFRSKSLTSLDFLRSLAVIGGDNLYNDRYALYVHDNENLETIWNWESHGNLTLRKGEARVLFHSNPRLCYDKIGDFLKSVVGLPITGPSEESLVMTLSNGNKMACHIMPQDIRVEPMNLRGVLKIRWFEVPVADDDRLLLGYYVYYKASEGLETYSGGRDSCTDDWMKKYVKVGKAEVKIQGYLKDLEPDTTYAIYVAADFIVDEKNGARLRSRVVYARTNPFNPDSPSDIRVPEVTEVSVSVSWSAPRRTHGVIDHYVVRVKEWPFPEVEGCADVHSPGYSSLRDQVSRTEIIRFGTGIIQDGMSTTTNPFEDAEASTEPIPKDSKEPSPSSLKARRQQLKKEIIFEDALFSLVYTGNGPEQGRDFSDDSIWEYDEYVGSSELDQVAPKVPEPSPTKYINPDTVDHTNRYMLEENHQREWTEATRKTNLTIKGLQSYMRYLVEVVACHGPKGDLVLCSTGPRTIAVLTSKKSGSSEVTDLSVLDSPQAGVLRLKWSSPGRLNRELVAFIITLHPQKTARRYWPTENNCTESCIGAREFRENNDTHEIRLCDLEPGVYVLGVRAVSNPRRLPTPTSTFGSRGSTGHEHTVMIRDHLLWERKNGPRTVYKEDLIMNHKRGIINEILGPLQFRKDQMETATVFPSTTIWTMVLVFTIILIALVTFFFFKKTPKKDSDSDDHAWNEAPAGDDAGSSSTNEYLRRMFPESHILQRNDLKIQFQNQLGSGHFGNVYGGVLSVGDARSSVPIAAKVISNCRSKSEILNEAKIMLELDCHHLVKPYGVAAGPSEVYLVMDLALQDLRSYLESLRPRDNSIFSSLTLEQVCALAIQIADGMAYLAKRGIVHRDLAARNCLLFENLHVKVSDFGMSRVTDNNYYKIKTTISVPVRWLPPEYFNHKRVTSQSDVWSYGVVVWEILTKGATPYKRVPDQRIWDHISEGNTLESEIASDTPHSLAVLITSCWNRVENLRPYFPQIVQTLYSQTSPCFAEEFRTVSFYHTAQGQEYKREVDRLRAAANEPVTCQSVRCDSQSPGQPPVSGYVTKKGVRDRPSVASSVPQEAQGLLEDSVLIEKQESETQQLLGVAGSANGASSSPDEGATNSGSTLEVCSGTLSSNPDSESQESSFKSNEDTDDQGESTSVNVDIQRARYSFTSTRNFSQSRSGRRSRAFSYHGVSSFSIED
ncbi:insulin-like peptide receptor [Macrobrachium rosenbergii]|uniref:insulin-like peptide receptor n=1 Tax=Macrobrachium rosenbergii TaxID=79674 RepID=UPI0034D75FDF